MHIILVTKKKFNHMFQLGAGAGAEICPEPEPEKSKMTGSGNPALNKHCISLKLNETEF